MVRGQEQVQLAEIPPYRGSKEGHSSRDDGSTAGASIPSTIDRPESTSIVPPSTSLLDEDTQKVLTEVREHVENNLEQFGDHVYDHVKEVPAYLQKYGELIQTSSSHLMANAADAFEQFSNPKLETRQDVREQRSMDGGAGNNKAIVETRQGTSMEQRSVEGSISKNNALVENHQLSMMEQRSVDGSEGNKNAIVYEREGSSDGNGGNNAIVEKRQGIAGAIDTLDLAFHTVESEMCSYDPKRIPKGSVLNREGGMIDDVFQNVESMICEAPGKLSLLSCPSVHPYQPTSIRTKTFPSPFFRKKRGGKKQFSEKELAVFTAQQDLLSENNPYKSQERNNNDSNESILSRDNVDQELKDVYAKITMSKSIASDTVSSVSLNKLSGLIEDSRHNNIKHPYNQKAKDVATAPTYTKRSTELDHRESREVSDNISKGVVVETVHGAEIDEESETSSRRKSGGINKAEKNKNALAKWNATKRSSNSALVTNVSMNSMPVTQSNEYKNLFHKDDVQLQSKSAENILSSNPVAARVGSVESKNLSPRTTTKGSRSTSALGLNIVDDASESSSTKKNKSKKQFGDTNSVSSWISRMSPIPIIARDDSYRGRDNQEIVKTSTTGSQTSSYSSKQLTARSKTRSQPRLTDTQSQSCGSNDKRVEADPMQQRLKGKNPYERIEYQEEEMKQLAKEEVAGGSLSDEQNFRQREITKNSHYTRAVLAAQEDNLEGKIPVTIDEELVDEDEKSWKSWTAKSLNSASIYAFDKYFIPDEDNLLRNRSLLDAFSVSTKTQSTTSANLNLMRSSTYAGVVGGGGSSRHSHGSSKNNDSGARKQYDLTEYRSRMNLEHGVVADDSIASVRTDNDSSMVVNLHDCRDDKKIIYKQQQQQKKPRAGMQLLKSFKFGQRKKKN